MPAAAITGLGLVTSLGPDAVTSAAAARAGITRPEPLALEVDGEPVVGHPAATVPAGLEGADRLLRLVTLALEDVLWSVPADVLQTARWLVALPAPLPAEPPPPLSGLEDAPVDPQAFHPPALDADALRGHIEDAVGARLDPDRFEAFAGRSGAVRALGHARRHAQERTPCVVMAVDSRVEVARALLAHGRVMAPGDAVGMQPGEAAGVAVVEPAGGRAAVGLLGTGGLDHEPHHLYSGRPALGRGLAAAVPVLEDVWPITDANGETYRAAEWGGAVRLSPTLRASFERASYPAADVGDTGAAAPMVALALAARAFERGYAPAPTALVLAADDTGGRGSIAVHAPS